MWEAPPPPKMSRTTRLSEVLNIFLFLSIRNFLLQFILLILTSQKYQESQYSNNDMQHFAKINQKQTNFCNLEFPLKTKYHFLKKENKNLFIYFYKFLQGRGVREKCNNYSGDLLIRKLTKIHLRSQSSDQQVPHVPYSSAEASNYCWNIVI